MALRLRRGTDAERQLITPLQGELIYATDTKKLFVGDGATVGGILVGPDPVDLADDASPQLGGDLDLNGNNITGTGNINIDGTITATGNINLGDAGSDEITVAGVINSDLRPAISQRYDLGSPARRWRNLHTQGVIVDNDADVGSLTIRGNIQTADSSILYNAQTGSITAEEFNGNVLGSVYADDSSTVLVDAANSILSNGTLSIAENTISIVDEFVDEVGINAKSVSQFVYGVDNSINAMGFLSIVGSGGTQAAPTTVQPGDLLGSFVVQGWGVDQPEVKALITGAIDTVTGTNPRPGKLLFSLNDADENFTTLASLNARGTFESGVFKATPFADAAARDAFIGTPEAGMVVYVEDVNKLQCYNGTTWNDLF